MKTLAVVLLVIMMACGGNGYGWVRPNDAVPMPGITKERIADRRPYVDIEEVPSIYRRPEDPIAGAVYFLFSDQGDACLVSDQDFTMAVDGEDWPCKWRSHLRVMD